MNIYDPNDPLFIKIRRQQTEMLNDTTFRDGCERLTKEMQAFEESEQQALQPMYQQSKLIQQQLRELWKEMPDLNEKMEKLSELKKRLGISTTLFLQHSREWDHRNKALLEEIEARLELVENRQLKIRQQITVIETNQKQCETIVEDLTTIDQPEKKSRQMIEIPWAKISLFLLDKIFKVSFLILILYNHIYNYTNYAIRGIVSCFIRSI